MTQHSPTAHKLKYFWLRARQALRAGRHPEVRTKDFFGRTLQRVVRVYRPRRILDIGSWDGRGTTTCLLSKLTYVPELIDCVELVTSRAEIIRREIVPLFPFVRVHNVSTLLYDDWSYKDFERDLWQRLPEDARARIKKHETLAAWQREEVALKGARHAFLPAAAAPHYELVVLDGGECTGWDEYRLMKGRFDIIAFDDVFKAFKSYWAYHDMRKDGEFELIAASCFVRRGFAVFARKGLATFAP